MTMTMTDTITAQQIADEALEIYRKTDGDMDAVLELLDEQDASNATIEAAGDLVAVQLRTEAKAGFDHANALETYFKTRKVVPLR